MEGGSRSSWSVRMLKPMIGQSLSCSHRIISRVVQQLFEGCVSFTATKLLTPSALSLIGWLRAAGTPIRGFGGVSQGSAPLVELISNIKATLKPLVGTALSVTAIVDIMNKVS